MDTELTGYLFVADISGYTSYLNASELEHARGTLTDLLQILIDRSGPPMTISKLEGDAVFSYGFEGAFRDGQTFVELVEGMYVAFRRAIDSMVLNNTCGCAACANVTSLDLKFAVHFGTFLIQDLGDFHELLGPDVNLVHRLLKNSVEEETGIRSYCLYTAAAFDELGLESLDGFIRHLESVPDFGGVETWIQDVGPAYAAAGAGEPIELSEDETLFVFEGDLPMTPAAVWDYLSDPEYRNVLVGSDREEITDRTAGRVGVGSAYQCYHGSQVVPHTIVEWRPFDRIVTDDVMPKPWTGSGLSVVSIEQTATGSHVERALGRMRVGRATRVMGKLGFLKLAQRLQQRAFERFLEAVRTDWADRSRNNRDAAIVTDEVVDAAARSSLRACRRGILEPGSE